MKFFKNRNKYDWMVILLISTLAFGGLGWGGLQVNRITTILLSPYLIQSIKQRYSIPINNYVFFVIFFLSYSIISLLWSVNKTEGIEEIVYFVIHFTLFIELLKYSTYSKQPLRSVSLGWIIALTITLTIALYELMTDQHLSTSKMGSGSQMNLGEGVIVMQKFAASTFNNYNTYVTFLCLAIPFVLYSITKGRKKVWLTIILLLSTVVILYDASRGGLLTLAGMVIIYLVCQKRYVVLYVTGGLLFILIPVLINMDGVDIFTVISHRASEDNILNGGSRIGIWLIGLEIIKSTFFIGVGVGGMDRHFSFYHSHFLIPHNMLLELIIKMGAVIGIVVIWQLLFLLLNVKRIHNKSIKTLLYCVLLTFPFYSIINSGYLLYEFTYAAFASWLIFYYYGIDRYNNKGVSTSHLA